jgi:hypothetical protein
VIVNGGHIEPLLTQLRDDGADFRVRQRKVAVRHGPGTHGLEGCPAGQSQPRPDRDAVHRHVEIRPRECDPVNVAIQLACPPNRAIDRGGIECGRLAGSGDQ